MRYATASSKVATWFLPASRGRQPSGLPIETEDAPTDRSHAIQAPEGELTLLRTVSPPLSRSGALSATMLQREANCRPTGKDPACGWAAPQRSRPRPSRRALDREALRCCGYSSPSGSEEDVDTASPVRALAVFGTGAPACSSFPRLSDPPALGSTSRTTTPLLLPVGTATLAEGHRLHHRPIACGSLVASQ
jgi:hypothetical protein